MTPRRTTGRPGRGLVLAAVAVSLTAHAVQVGALLGARSVVDRQTQVSDLRLGAAFQTFRPVDHPGLAEPAAPGAFSPDRNPRTDPAGCGPLTVLTSTVPLDGRTWTGVGGRPAQPVTLLTARFADAGAARRELDRKAFALLRCSQVAVTFPPYDEPPTTYAVKARRWDAGLTGSGLRWSLDGGGRRFDFYVRRYGNTLTWTYADDVSTPQVREEVADSLVTRLEDLAHR